MEGSLSASAEGDGELGTLFGGSDRLEMSPKG